MTNRERCLNAINSMDEEHLGSVVDMLMSEKFKTEDRKRLGDLFVVSAIAGDDYTVYFSCNDGTVRKFDMKPMIEKIRAFAPLVDHYLFRKNLIVIKGTIAWVMDNPPGIGVTPFTLFEGAHIVEKAEGNEFSRALESEAKAK